MPLSHASASVPACDRKLITFNDNGACAGIRIREPLSIRSTIRLLSARWRTEGPTAKSAAATSKLPFTTSRPVFVKLLFCTRGFRLDTTTRPPFSSVRTAGNWQSIQSTTVKSEPLAYFHRPHDADNWERKRRSAWPTHR